MTSQSSEAAPGPIRHRLVDELRSSISRGERAPGSRLNERELCDTFSVSRTVVRETLRQLEAEGFVTVVANRGAIVATISYEGAVGLYELRAALESLASSLFAARGSLEQKRALMHSIRMVERAMAGADLDSILESKNAFYDSLLAGAGNPELTTTLRLLHGRIQVLRRYSLTAPGRNEHSVNELHAIANAIIAGDVDGARVAAQVHVERASHAALPQIFRETMERNS